MSTVEIYGEISADGKSIIIMAAGAIHAVASQAKKLGLITPLISKSNPPGASVVPLSWPAVVQMSFTFGAAWTPGPKLTKWCMDEVSKRCGHGRKELRYQLPQEVIDLGFELYSWQIENAKMVAHCSGGLITDDPGLGKTQSAIVGLAERELWGHVSTPAVVTCPPSVVDSWVRAFELWAPWWRTTAWRGTPAKRAALVGEYDIYVTGYPLARRDAAPGMPLGKSPLAKIKPRSVVADEIQNCFPADTLVNTPAGPRPIQYLNPGDVVFGVDHKTGQTIETHVLRKFKRQTDQPLTKVNGIPMTPEHPVWTSRGYVPAADIGELDSVCTIRLRSHHDTLQSDLRVVRARVNQTGQARETAPILQHELFGQVAYVQTGICSVTRHLYASSFCTPQYAEIVAGESWGDSGTTGVLSEQPESVQGSSGSSQSTQGIGVYGIQTPDGGQWSGRNQTSSATSDAPGLAYGGSNSDRTQEPMADVVQDRHCGTWADDSHRSRRCWSQQSGSAQAGRQENAATNRIRVDGSTLHESSNTTRNGNHTGTDNGNRTVYNIETGTNNYLVGWKGLLVHNCNNPDAVQTRAVQRLSRLADCLVPMSGTPVTHNVKGLHPTLEVMEPGAYPSGERFTDRYALELNGDYGSPEIIGLNPHNEPEFRTSLLGRMTRHNKTACLPDLPPKVYSIRHVELPPQYLKVYRDMEAKMIAEMPDGQELTVMGVLAQIVRLQQLSSAAADVESYEELDEKTGEIKIKQKVTLKFPSWKVDALLEVLAERPGQPVVCFAPSRQLIMLAGQAAAAQGLRVGHIVGGQTPAERTASIDTFQAGKLDLLCATTQAGGTGLTLTAAGCFVFLQRPYSLVESLQAEDRGHRIGTKHDSVEIIDIYATGTIDSAIRSVLHDKADQLGELLRDPAIVSGLFGGLSARKPARHLVAVS
jgi:hypothetical protein